MAFALAYGLLCRIGLAFLQAPDAFAAIWPAAGLALGVLVLVAPEWRPAYLAAIGLTNFAVHAWGGSGWVAVGLAAVNTAEAGIGVWVMARVLRGAPVVFGASATLRALLAAAVVAAASAGVVATAVVLPLDEGAIEGWLTWVLADGVGMLTVAPIVWAVRARAIGPERERTVELVGFWIAFAVVTWAILLRLPSEASPLDQYPFPVFPVLLWGALRLGPRVVAGALGAMMVAACAGFALGGGPFVGNGLGEREGLLAVQVFLGAMTLTTLVVCSVARHQLQLIDRLRQTLADQRSVEAALAASETRHRLLLANLPDAMIALYDRDLVGIMVEGQLLADRGLDRTQLVGRRLRDALPPEHGEPIEALMRAALAGEAGQYEYPGEQGGAYAVEIVPYRDDAHAITGAFTIVRSIAERRQAEALAVRAQARFEAVFGEAPIGVAVLDASHRVLQANAALERITGYEVAWIEGRPLGALLEVADAALLERRLRALTADDAPVGGDELELHCAHPDGHRVVLDVRLGRLTSGEDEPARAFAQVLDVTERTQYKEQLRHLAEHDPLTHLANRRRFEAELERHLDQVARYGAGGAVMVLDVDHFKQVNDTLGHAAGDALIVALAAVLKARLRRSDVVARFGGDEFAILLPHGDREEAEAVARALVDAVHDHPFVLAPTGSQRRISISLGVAPLEPGGELSEESVLADADLAMYDAKEAGRDRYAFSSGSGRTEPLIRARMAWLERIENALANDGFTLLAQPILDLRRDEVTQWELLLRMRARDGSLISPGEFLPVAERYDLITRIDAWVTEAAVGLLELHQRAGDPIRLEVNLSGRTIGDAEAVKRIEAIVRGAAIDPRALIFEVTETAAVADIAHARRFAERMRELGCRFALDDFGAGFGSFYYLKHLPFDYLKIDGEFISASLRDPTDRLVIRSIVQIAQGLGTSTIAEFVPDGATRRMLASMGVDYAQGYHVGRPAPLPPPGRFSPSGRVGGGVA